MTGVLAQTQRNFARQGDALPFLWQKNTQISNISKKQIFKNNVKLDKIAFS
jgi:hypothetical protein